jgi:YD repeat-containing protein
VTFVRDAQGRITQITDLAGNSLYYTYDHNGNTTRSTGSHYTYDFENRLMTANDGTVTYLYDGDGNRVAQIAMPQDLDG